MELIQLYSERAKNYSDAAETLLEIGGRFFSELTAEEKRALAVAGALCDIERFGIERRINSIKKEAIYV